MPKFDITIQGQTFEVEAPNEQALPEIAETISKQVFGEIRRGDPLAKTERLIEQRESLLPTLGKELAFRPFSQENIERVGLPRAALQQTLKPAVLGLKGLGTAFQIAESAEATPLVELTRRPKTLQRILQPGRLPFELGAEVGAGRRPTELLKRAGKEVGEIAEAQKKALTGQRVVEFGDVFRQAGVPEPISASLGLFLATQTPLTGGLLKAAEKPIKKLFKLKTFVGEDKAEKLLKPIIKTIKKAKKSVKQTFMDLFESTARVPSVYTETLIDNFDEVFTKGPTGNRTRGKLLEVGRDIRKAVLDRRKNVGGKFGFVKKRLMRDATKQIDISDLQRDWRGVLNRFNLLDPQRGTIRSEFLTSGDRTIRQIVNIDSRIAKLSVRGNTSFRQGQLLLDDITKLLDFGKSGTTPLIESEEAILKILRRKIRKRLGDVGGDSYNKLAAQFEEIADIDGTLSRFGLRDDKRVESLVTNLFKSGNEFLDETSEKLWSVVAGGKALRKKALFINAAQAFSNRSFQGIRTGLISGALGTLGFQLTGPLAGASGIAVGIGLTTPRAGAFGIRQALKLGKAAQAIGRGGGRLGRFGRLTAPLATKQIKK
ncbi:MAG TPA: hypothetical protein ENH85_14070 [Candidatus Scalindua sp.]|nr:hypothetical protein [Candidatus Scalindua sp.]